MTHPIPRLAAAALLYGAFLLGANAAGAQGLAPAERAELEAMRTGDMEKLVFHDEPYAPIEEAWTDAHGNPVSLADYRGKVVVVNFWATWCPPCVEEMPSLDRLAERMQGKGVAVVPISIDREVARIERFFAGNRIENLDIHHDADRKVSRRAGVLGLPVTAIVDAQGHEVARLVGDAEWDSPEAVALIERLVGFLTDGNLQSAGGGGTENSPAPEG